VTTNYPPIRDATTGTFNFRNDIYDLGLTGEFFFYENNDLGNTYKYRNGFRAYIFGGVGGFYSNPKTLYQGQWVALRPYATEGVHYKAINLNIPMGIGFYFTIDKTHRIGFEMNYRKTFTDYLDDISGQYPSKPDNAYEQGLILRTASWGLRKSATIRVRLFRMTGGKNAATNRIRTLT